MKKSLKLTVDAMSFVCMVFIFYIYLCYKFITHTS